MSSSSRPWPHRERSRPSQVFALGLAVGPGLMALYLCALVFLSRYHMTRVRHLEILTELERRRKRAGVE